MKNNLYNYKILFAASASRLFKKLPNNIQKDVLLKLKQLVSVEHSLDTKKLEGYPNFFRLKCGKYRVVYEPIHNKIIIYVLYLGHRREIYKEFKNYFK